MTITVQTPGAANSGNTSVAIAYPTVAAGDLLLLVATAKYSAFTSAPPTGFLDLPGGALELVAGSGGTGVDAGNTRTRVWYRIATGSETGTVSVTKTTETGTQILGQMLRFSRSAGNGWAIIGTSGSSASGTTAWSAAGSNNIYIAAGDVVVCASGINTDGQTYSSHGLSATGCTFAAASEVTDTGTSGGHDEGLLVVTFACSTGPSSAAPTFTSTANGGTPEGGTLIVRVRESLGLVAAQGTHTLTGKDAGLTKQYRLYADQGSIALTGQDAGLSGAATRAWAEGAWSSLAWYGTSWFGQGPLSYPLAVDQGAYALTGQDAGLRAARKLTPVELGNITLGGQDAGLLKGYRLTAEQGSHALTPQTFASSRTYRITPDYGTYALSGADVFFQGGAVVGRAWVAGAWYADAWEGTVWGDNAAAPNNYLMSAEPGAYLAGSLDFSAPWVGGAWSDGAWVGTAWGGGIQTGLYANYRLTAEPGSYAYTGDDPVYRDILLQTTGASYAVTGQDAALFKGYVLSAGAGSYALTGQSAGGLRGYHMDAGFGAYLTIGYDADFPIGTGAYLNTGTFALTGQDAGLFKHYRLTADVGAIALTGQDVRLVFGDFMSGEGGTYALSGQDAGLLVGYRLNAATGYYTVGGQLVPYTEAPVARGGAGKKRNSRPAKKDVWDLPYTYEVAEAMVEAVESGPALDAASFQNAWADEFKARIATLEAAYAALLEEKRTAEAKATEELLKRLLAMLAKYTPPPVDVAESTRLAEELIKQVRAERIARIKQLMAEA